MKVSVIIPTYNRCDLVRRAVTSALGQTGAQIDIVVVDDGSTDSTREEVERIAQHSPLPIRYIWKSNGGCASARNVGLREVTGEAFIFLDSDDVFDSQAIASLVNALEKTGADFAYSPATEVFPDGKERLNFPVAAEKPEELAAAYFMYPNVRNGAVLFRRYVIDEVGYLDDSLRHNEDTDYLQRVAIKCKAAYSPAPTVRVYHHGANKSSNRIALHRALITSVQRILDGNPSFRSRLGGLAERRLNQLRSRLVFAVIMSGNYEEARQELAAVHGPMALVATLAIATRSRWPVVFVEFLTRIRTKLVLVTRRSGSSRRTGSIF
jgi:glycosyltransferase involved in cell wall biosynthesis